MGDIKINGNPKHNKIPRRLTTDTTTIRLQTTSCATEDNELIVQILSSFPRLEILEIYHDRFACEEEMSSTKDYCTFDLKDTVKKVVNIIFNKVECIQEIISIQCCQQLVWNGNVSITSEPGEETNTFKRLRDQRNIIEAKWYNGAAGFIEFINL